MPKNKQLIIYFTSSGTTKRAAEDIKKYTNADMIELLGAVPYPTEYEKVGERGKEELDQNIHPAIDPNTIPDVSKYDEIFIGFPTWWAQPPMIIHSLFEQVDFSGKTIIPFTTSMSSTMADSMPYLKKMTADTQGINLINGIRYQSSTDLHNFLKQNNLI